MYGQLQQILTDSTEELHSTCTEGLRKVRYMTYTVIQVMVVVEVVEVVVLLTLHIQALTEERKLYCFVVDHFCSVVHNQIAYNSTVSNHVCMQHNSHISTYDVHSLIKYCRLKLSPGPPSAHLQMNFLLRV